MYGNVANKSTLQDKQADKQAPNAEKLETRNRENKPISTPMRAVQYPIDLSTKDIVQEKTLQGDIKDCIPTFREHLNFTTHMRDSTSQNTPTRDVLTTIKTLKGGGEHQSPTGEFKTPEGDGYNTNDRDREEHSNAIGDKLSKNGPRNKGTIYLTPNGGDNKCLATSKSDKKAGEETLENAEAKMSLLKYTNQTSIMALTGK